MSSRLKKSGVSDITVNKSELSVTVAWPEWSDSELNSEKWDYLNSVEFVDPQRVTVPPSLRLHKWIRFRELKNVVSPVIFVPITDYPNLIINNKHLLHSEFMRCFVSTIINVQYCGRNGLQIENQSSNFAWNTIDQSWQGWFHIYSLNKVAKGVPHHPVVNHNGKYIVRIFFMGCWRRILIDDTIPVDKIGRPLLPSTANSNEMWPMLLAKAILKIAALSWTPEREIVDCNFIMCLTGWIGLSLNVSHLSPCDQWQFITKYAKHFEWSQDTEAINTKKRNSQILMANVEKLQVPHKPKPTLVILSLEDMKDIDPDEISNIAMRWNHQIYVKSTRDNPLDSAKAKSLLTNWKKDRWINWATQRGLIDASEYLIPTRHLLIVSPLRELNGNVTYAYDGNDDFDEAEPSKVTSSNMLKRKSQEKIGSSSTNLLKKGKSRKTIMPDISLWGDFNKLTSYLRDVHLFYRQTFFNCTVEVTDNVLNFFSHDESKTKTGILNQSDKKIFMESASTGRSDTTRFYEYQDRFSKTRNEALYLFVDSAEDKFFLINLSTMAYDILNVNDSTKITSLIIERYNWFDTFIENKSVIDIKTRGSKSTVFELEPGRHLLRIFLSSESAYHMTISSDTQFQIGNRLKMHHLMTTESVRINVFAQHISNCVKKAFESFGSASYATDLKVYYQSYMSKLSKTVDTKNCNVLKLIHDYFLEEFIKLIEKAFPSTELEAIQRAFRIFFLDSSITIKINAPGLHKEKETTENIEGIDETRTKAAIKIQSFFRMVLIKCYKNIQKASHKEHNRVKESLQKVIELFNYDRQESVAQVLLRATIKRDSTLKSLYPFVSDFKNVIQIQELHGQVPNVSPDQWVPIVRITINANKYETVMAAMDVFTNLINYTLRVFANDTKREMPRIVNNVTPIQYTHRTNGYTIFAYGWSSSEKLKEFQWSLHLTTIKGEPMFYFLNKDAVTISPKNEISPLVIREISNTYIPNIQNYIMKLILRIKKRCLVSLRLQNSYERVLIKLRIVTENGAPIKEIEGGGTVILPLAILEMINADSDHILAREANAKVRKSVKSLTHRNTTLSNQRSGSGSKRNSNEKSDDHGRLYTQYCIEAFVLHNSWPLTEAEWSVVAEAKANNSNEAKSRKTLTSDRSKSKQFLKKFIDLNVLQQPFWILQIVTDAGDEIEIFEDRSNEDRIDELKKKWKSEDLGRSERGRELRKQFLDENCLITAQSVIDAASKTESMTSTFPNIISSKTERTLEPPVGLSNHLPKLDLSIYMVKEDEEEDRWIKSEYDEETLRNRRAMNVLDFGQRRSSFLEHASKLLNNRREKYRKLSAIHSQNFAKRSRAIDELYDLRQAYIDSITNTNQSIKTNPTKQEKKKKKPR